MNTSTQSQIALVLILVITAALVILHEDKWTFYAWCMALWLLILNIHDFGHALTAKLLGGGFGGAGGAFNWLGSPNILTHYIMPLVAGGVMNVYLPGGAVYVANVALHKIKAIIVYAGGPLICWLLGILLFGLVGELIAEEKKLFWTGIDFALFACCMQCILSLIPIPPSDGFFAILDILCPGKIREPVFAKLNPSYNIIVSILVYVVYVVLVWLVIWEYFYDWSIELARLFGYENRAALGAASFDMFGLSEHRGKYSDN